MSLRAFPPLRADHPLVTDKDKCPLCDQTFLAEDVVTLLPIKPAGTEDAAKAKAGKAYTAVATPVHLGCTRQLVEYLAVNY